MSNNNQNKQSEYNYSEWFLGFGHSNLSWVGYVIHIPFILTIFYYLYRIQYSVNVMKDHRKHMTHNILSLLMLRVIQVFLLVNFFVISFRIYFISFDNFSEFDLKHYVKPVFLIYKLLQLLS